MSQTPCKSNGRKSFGTGFYGQLVHINSYSWNVFIVFLMYGRYASNTVQRTTWSSSRIVWVTPNWKERESGSRGSCWNQDSRVCASNMYTPTGTVHFCCIIYPTHIFCVSLSEWFRHRQFKRPPRIRFYFKWPSQRSHKIKNKKSNVSYFFTVFTILRDLQTALSARSFLWLPHDFFFGDMFSINFLFLLFVYHHFISIKSQRHLQHSACIISLSLFGLRFNWFSCIFW